MGQPIRRHRERDTKDRLAHLPLKLVDEPSKADLRRQIERATHGVQVTRVPTRKPGNPKFSKR
jgi:hypothetical protein